MFWLWVTVISTCPLVRNFQSSSTRVSKVPDKLRGAPPVWWIMFWTFWLIWMEELSIITHTPSHQTQWIRLLFQSRRGNLISVEQISSIWEWAYSPGIPIAASSSPSHSWRPSWVAQKIEIEWCCKKEPLSYRLLVVSRYRQYQTSHLDRYGRPSAYQCLAKQCVHQSCIPFDKDKSRLFLLKIAEPFNASKASLVAVKNCKNSGIKRSRDEGYLTGLTQVT